MVVPAVCIRWTVRHGGGDGRRRPVDFDLDLDARRLARLVFGIARPGFGAGVQPKVTAGATSCASPFGAAPGADASARKPATRGGDVDFRSTVTIAP